MRSDRVQRQVAQPGLQAAALATQEIQQATQEKAHLTEQIEGIQRQHSPEALATAQRQQAGPVTPPTRPQSVGDWVSVMRMQAEQMDGRRVSARESASFTQLQRQVSQTLITSYRADRQPPLQRQAEYGDHLATLQRHPLSRGIPGFVIGQIPPSERSSLQRAVAEAVQRQQAAAEASSAARQFSDLQGQQSALEAQQAQALHERIQARRGAGNPLPAAVLRHLEQGLNHDLSLVRIHDDAEADKMAKSVNAIAFTTGTDIFFQSGHYDPNTQTGLELLAHEVTHTVQQSKGQVGKGIDPDAGLESEARETGRRLAQHMPDPHSLIPPVPHKDGPHAPGVYTQQAATERIQTGAARHTSLKPLRELNAGMLQAMAMQRFSLNPVDWAKAGAEKLKEAALSTVKALPGYREVSAAVGHDLITGGAVESGPGVLETLANWVPGPLKDILKALQETNVIGQAWDWFKGQLAGLDIGGALGEIKDAIFKLPPDLGAAVNAVTSRIGRIKNLIVGSAKKIAEIALTAITAMMGPVGKQLMAKLKGSGDTIVKILKNPVAFAKNLMEAAKGGFSKFGQNAPTHLKNGLGIWLTGDSDGLKFPPQMDIEGVFMLAMTVSGVSYMNMLGGLQRKLGPNGAAALQRATMILPELTPLKGGVQKAPEIASNQNAMGQEVVGDLKNEVFKSLVVAGIAKVASMLIPGGGFIQAIVGAFSAVQTLIAQGQQIAQVMIDGLSGVEAIAAGNISGAVSFIDRTLGGTIPVILSFMSRFLGLGRFGGKAKGIIGKVKARLKAFEQRIVERIGGIVQKILAKTKLDKTNLLAKHRSKQTRDEQSRTAQANTAASKRNAALNTANTKASQSGSKRNAESSRANTAQAQKANTANAAAAKTHKDSTDPNPRINIASKGEKAATASIDKKTQATKKAADQDAKKVKADADKAEREAQALAKKQTKDAHSSADRDQKEATTLATRDAKGHPGSDTNKAKTEATQAATKVKTKAKGEESKTTSKAKTDSKKAKDKAEQGAKKTKADADKQAKKDKKKAKDDATKARKKAKDDAKKAQAKKKKDSDKKGEKPKSPIKLGDKKKDSKKPRKDKDNVDTDGTYGKVQFQALKESHSVWTTIKSNIPRIFIASTPAPANIQLSNFKVDAVKYNIYNELRPHFQDAGHAVAKSLAILRDAPKSKDRNIRLMIDAKATEANNQVARYVEVIRRRIQEESKKPSSMPAISVIFSSTSYPKDLQEYRLQLYEQQVGINSKTIAEWQNLRENFLKNGRGSETAQRLARINRLKLLQSSFTDRLMQNDPNISIKDATTEATILAKEWLNAQSALHAPDQVAGGIAKEIAALGKKEINKSIGGAWPHRISIIDSGISAFLSQSPAPDPKIVNMNVRLSI